MTPFDRLREAALYGDWLEVDDAVYSLSDGPGVCRSVSDPSIGHIGYTEYITETKRHYDSMHSHTFLLLVAEAME